MSSDLLIDSEAADSSFSGLAPDDFARLVSADDPAVFAAAWLNAIATQTNGMQQGLLVLAAARGGRNERAAMLAAVQSLWRLCCEADSRPL